MNRVPSSLNNIDNSQPDDVYVQWQNAMQNIKFQGDKVLPQTNKEAEHEDNGPKTTVDDESASSESKERIPRRSVSEIIKILDGKEIEQTEETALRPRAEVICDHDHIEGQRIDVIDKRDQGTREFSFKLRTPTEAVAAMATKMIASSSEAEDGQTEVTTPSGATLRRGVISCCQTYTDKDLPYTYSLCEAFVFEKDGVKVSIADPAWAKKGARVAIGLIKIETPIDMEPEATEQLLGEILEKDLGIPGALDEVSEEAERDYKMARYKWQHVIDGELTPEQAKQAENLEREEVFPGYTTLIERGKHKEYLRKYGEDIRLIHVLHTGSPKSIYRILTQGLMCTTERYNRGVMRSGMSSDDDIRDGGADSVFTRVSNEAQRGWIMGPTIVLKPEVFDRTDWYAYPDDEYGSTKDTTFLGRISPDTLIPAATSLRHMSANEQMFRTGIGANFIESVLVHPAARERIITELRSMGLEEVDGKPIEEIIVAQKPRNPLLSSPPSSPPAPFSSLAKPPSPPPAPFSSLAKPPLPPESPDLPPPSSSPPLPPL